MFALILPVFFGATFIFLCWLARFYNAKQTGNTESICDNLNVFSFCQTLCDGDNDLTVNPLWFIITISALAHIKGAVIINWYQGGGGIKGGGA